MADINLSPYSAEYADIQRRQRMADMLAQQSQQPLETNQTAGGYVVPVSPLAGLAKMLQGYTAGMASNRALQDERALGEKMRSDQGADFTKMVQMLQPRAATPGQQGIDTDFLHAPEQAPQPAKPMGQIDPMEAGSLRTPEMQAMARALLLKQFEPKAPIKLGKDDTLLAPDTYKPIATGKGGFHVVGNNLVPEPSAPGSPVAPVFTAPEKSPEAIRTFETALRSAGIDPKSPQGMAAYAEFVKKQTSHPAPANVNVKTDVKTGESLAGQVGPMMRDSTIAAEGAVRQVDAAKRIVQAVDSGKIITGPTADARLFIGQVGQALGVGGANEAEKIANTRQALRGLAELTLQGRQQMRGQGAITESEGKLAERAMSGEISFTASEIKQLAKASERSARFQHAEHMRKLKVMQENPALQGIAPFYQGPAMPAEGLPPADAPSGWKDL